MGWGGECVYQQNLKWSPKACPNHLAIQSPFTQYKVDGNAEATEKEYIINS